MVQAEANVPTEAEPESEAGPTRLNVQFVLDGEGKRVAAVLAYSEFVRLMDELEDLEATLDYDEAKAEGGEAIPWETLRAELESDDR